MALDPLSGEQRLTIARARQVGRRWWLLFVLGLVSTAAGIFVLVYPWTLATVAILIGAVLIYRGLILALIPSARGRQGWNMALGVINLLVGAAVLVWPAATLLVLATIIGVWLIISGTFDIAASLAERRVVGHWGLLLLRGVIAVPLGIVALLQPTLTIEVLVAVIGIWLILVGILEIILSLEVRRLPRLVEARSAAVEEAERLVQMRKRRE